MSLTGPVHGGPCKAGASVVDVATGIFAALYAVAAQSILPEKIRDLAFGENDAKVDAIAALVAEGDSAALALLQAFSGELPVSGLKQLTGLGVEVRLNKKVARTAFTLPA